MYNNTIQYIISKYIFLPPFILLHLLIIIMQYLLLNNVVVLFIVLVGVISVIACAFGLHAVYEF